MRNQSKLYDRFDAAVLLSAPADVILDDLANVEPLVRAGSRRIDGRLRLVSSGGGQGRARHLRRCIRRGRPARAGTPGGRSDRAGPAGVAHIRVLVTDDSAYDRLVEEIASGRGAVMVLEQATRCNELLRAQPGWSAERSETAMVLPDLDSMPDAALPDGLELRRVGPDGVTLEEAAAVGVASDPGITEPADVVAGFLGGLPPSVRLLAAVDERGVAHATSACHVFGEYTQIFFVNTEPSWRRRGIGRAMTREALKAAALLGARRALLHATPDGASVYTSLGFEAVGVVTRYSGPG